MPPAAMPNRALTLPPDELARRLAWLFWRAPADETVRLQVMGVKDTDGLAGVVTRLLADGRSQGGADALARAWLKSDAPLLIGQPDATIGEVTPALRASMATEPQLFLRRMLTDRATLGTFLTAPFSFMDESLARLYGVPAPAGWAYVPLPPGERSGVLSQPGMAWSHRRAPQRAQWLRETFLCEAVPPPPAGVFAEVKQGPTETWRQAHQREIAQPQCTACHALLHLGFALEHYDQVGRYRTTDNGLPIDASTTLRGLSTPEPGIPVKDAPDLGRALAQQCDVHRCVARTFLAHALDRPLEAGDFEVTEVTRAFLQANLRLADLLLAVVQSPSFIAP
jgi:hypothetical protein